jgi:hypothetical protein
MSEDGGTGAGGGTGGIGVAPAGGGGGGVGAVCASNEPANSNDPAAMKGSNGLRDFMIDTPCQNEGSNVVSACHPPRACGPDFVATLHGGCSGDFRTCRFAMLIKPS